MVKPVSPERFNTAIQKAAGLLELRRKAEAAEASALPDEFFFVFSEYQQVKITISDLLYVEAMGDYVKLFLSTQPKPVLTLERMKILADRLQQHGFRRIHRSYLVNMKKVAALQKARLRVADVWLPVGETYMEGLKDL